MTPFALQPLRGRAGARRVLPQAAARRDTGFIHIYIYIHMYTHTHVHTHEHAYKTHTYIYICICIYIYIFIYIYIYISRHILLFFFPSFFLTGCKIQAQHKGGVRADSMSSLVVATRERHGSLGVGFENMRRSLVMK